MYNTASSAERLKCLKCCWCVEDWFVTAVTVFHVRHSISAGHRHVRRLTYCKLLLHTILSYLCGVHMHNTTTIPLQCIFSCSAFVQIP